MENYMDLINDAVAEGNYESAHDHLMDWLDSIDYDQSQLTFSDKEAIISVEELTVINCEGSIVGDIVNFVEQSEWSWILKGFCEEAKQIVIEDWIGTVVYYNLMSLRVELDTDKYVAYSEKVKTAIVDHLMDLGYMFDEDCI